MLILLALAAIVQPPVPATEPAAIWNAVAAPATSAYVGTYDYGRRDSIVIVPGAGASLIAMFLEGKYPLRPAGTDRFINPRGDTIPFVRDGSSQVTGFVESGVRFARRHGGVPAAVRVLFTPRRDANGDPVLGYRYVAPRQAGDGISVGTLLGAGLQNERMETMVRRVLDGSYPDVHSILLLVRDTLVLEEYFYGTTPDTPHQLRSATKSIISLLAGIALSQGLIASDTIDAMRALGYPAANNGGSTIRLRDLLTMRTGLACEDWDPASPGNESRMYEQPDWMAFFAGLPRDTTPGTRASYCSGAALAVGRIIERAAGIALPAYAQRELFAPLGIQAEDVRWQFRLDSSAPNDFGQIWLRPRDMAKIGMLVANGGAWGGRQVVPGRYIAAATARHTAIGSRGYGYLWWHQWFGVQSGGAETRVETVVASGHGGQKIYIVPAFDAVVVFTGGAYSGLVESAANDIVAREMLPALLDTRAERRRSSLPDVSGRRSRGYEVWELAGSLAYCSASVLPETRGASVRNGVWQCDERCLRDLTEIVRAFKVEPRRHPIRYQTREDAEYEGVHLALRYDKIV
ncbi:MAG: serine hydrolase [Gemmatimonadota bacterium]